MLTYVFLSIVLLYYGVWANVVEKVGNDIQLTGKGQTLLDIPEFLTFSMLKSCAGKLKICYESDKLDCKNDECENLNDLCPHGSCMLDFRARNPTFNDLLDIQDKNDRVIGTLKQSNKYCRMKKSARQSFTILELPQCAVSIIGASLPQNEEKDEDDDKEEEEEILENGATTANADVARWAYPVGIISSVVILVGIGLCSFGLYKFCKNKKTTDVPKPKQVPSPPKTIVTVSPHQNPTSPLASPAVSPLTTPVTTTPPTVPKAESPAVTPTCVKIEDGTTPKAAQVFKNEVKREEKPKPASKARPASIQTTITTCETTEDYGIVQLIEEHADSLNRWGQLHFKGVHPIEVGSRRHPFLQVIYKKFRSTHRRQIQQYELEFFASDVSSVFQEAKWRLKDTRQVLCRHGAVYEHGQWKSFNEATYDYLAKSSTPGLVVAYAFASEYGGDITLKVDNASTRRILRKLSAPALLTVFLRENLPAIVRRRAFARLRRLLPHIDRLFPDSQLRGLAYPLSLIPAMKEIDRHILRDAAKDTTLTLLEQKKRGLENPVVTVIDELDETQVSDSDVDKDVRSVDRSKAKSAPTLTEELKEMLFGSKSR